MAGGGGVVVPAAVAPVIDDAELPGAALARMAVTGGVAAAAVILYAVGRWRVGDIVGFSRLRGGCKTRGWPRGGDRWVGSVADVLLDAMDEWEHGIVD
eukprot:TRINITY_DN16906_c0_g1_i1.p2 TRINITY_DN16906_c0_g1~~TRINITY_DN16906_c0_g1_i1.p2  ORF type:complete len:113 (-),score=43.96 TRINITY_DN16906_c0_g1_i1:302-595(-)